MGTEVALKHSDIERCRVAKFDSFDQISIVPLALILLAVSGRKSITALRGLNGIKRQKRDLMPIPAIFRDRRGLALACLYYV
jgi:hypothetical protein